MQVTKSKGFVPTKQNAKAKEGRSVWIATVRQNYFGTSKEVTKGKLSLTREGWIVKEEGFYGGYSYPHHVIPTGGVIKFFFSKREAISFLASL